MYLYYYIAVKKKPEVNLWSAVFLVCINLWLNILNFWLFSVAIKKLKANLKIHQEANKFLTNLVHINIQSYIHIHQSKKYKT